MHVCIDARISRGSWFTGVGKYTINLVDHLARLAPNHTYTILVHPAAEPIPVREPQRFRIVPFQVGIGSIKQHFWMPFWLKREGVDVILHTHPGSAMIFQTCPSIIVVLDVYPLRFPQQFGLSLYIAYKFIIPRAIRKSYQCIAISKCTKEDAVNYFSIPDEKVEVVYLAASEVFRPIQKGPLLNEVLSKYNVYGSYILYHGNKRPHKNVEGLLKSFWQLKKQSCLPHKLVITGEENSKELEYDSSHLRKLIDELGIGKEVHFTGLVSEEDLPYIYSGADLLVIPSYYEGFGLPALEAMACGTPVVASDRGALPEVVSDAGLLVNPYDLGALSRTIQSVLEDERLRKQLIERGLERAKYFSWEKNSEKTMQILKNAVLSKETKKHDSELKA
jgi:glycosyltransferase involved in cell wall biosynthesis